MDAKKKKLIVVAGGAVAVGAFLYTQRGKDGVVGTAGSVIAAPIETFTGSDDPGLPGTDTPAGEWIPELMEQLPTFGEGGDMLPYTPLPELYDTLAPTVSKAITGSKKGSTLANLGGLAGKALIGTTKVGATGVMMPVQILGGTTARLTDKFARYAMGSNIKSLRTQQKKRVKKYGRTSHAVSMITGGATARSPVTKKQQRARKRYPRVYKAWKSIFSWVGA